MKYKILNWFFVFALRTFSMKMCAYFCNAFSIRCYSRENTSFSALIVSYLHFILMWFLRMSAFPLQSHEFNARRQHFAKDDELCICLSHFVFFLMFFLCAVDVYIIFLRASLHLSTFRILTYFMLVLFSRFSLFHRHVSLKYFNYMRISTTSLTLTNSNVVDHNLWSFSIKRNKR